MFEVISILVFSLLPVSKALSCWTAPNATATGENVVGPTAALYIANKGVAPDGYNRSATLVNGVFPAPLIMANKNDPFSLQIINQLTDDTMPLNTSVHWHGIFQKGSNWADGVAYITQCPIRPDKSFTYKFNATNQTGTYWYHSHYSTQYCDGLRGPLVIYDPEDPHRCRYDVDDASTIITLSDWYHKTSNALNGFSGPVIPNSTLINGRGRWAGNTSVALSVIKVQPGKRYRLRVLSLSCNPVFNFAIDGHRMTIVEVEGTAVDPLDVDSIPIFTGQRYSVVITANQSVGNYWIRASTNFDATFDGGRNSAILRYEGAPDQDPTSAPGPYELPFDEGKLYPLINPGAPGIPEIGGADVNIQLPPGYKDGVFTLGLANKSFVYPSIPELLQILDGSVHPSQLLPHGSVYELPPNKTIQITFPNPEGLPGALVPGAPHPMHLHGHNFDVVRVAGSNVTNFVNPVRRDVVSMGHGTDNVTIRFVTDNPGPWFLHCHIDWHLYSGFAVVMAEALPETAVQEAPAVPPEWKQLCDADYTELMTIGN